MIRAFAELIVVDAVRARLEWQIKVLTMNCGAAVRVLRLNVLQQLVDSNVWREILRVRSENVEQLLVNVMVRELVLAGVGIIKSWARLLVHRRQSRVLVAIVNIVKFIVIVRRRGEHIVVVIVLLVVFIELLVRFFLGNFRRFAIVGGVERHFDFMFI